MENKAEINLDDFRCLRRGQQLSVVSRKNATLLERIELRPSKEGKAETERALLLLHGFSSSPAVFRELLPFLMEYDTIVAPVLPGHAANLQAFSEAKASDWVLEVENAYQDLAEEFKQIDVMGLSLGGVLACHLSSRFPLNHLYLLAPALDLHLAINKTILLGKCLQNLGFKRVRSLAGDLFTSTSYEMVYRQLPISTIVEILGFINSFDFRLPTCPTDLFLGRHDNVVASEHVALRFVNQANIQIHWLDKSAHVLPLDGDIEKIIDCIKKNGSI